MCTQTFCRLPEPVNAIAGMNYLVTSRHSRSEYGTDPNSEGCHSITSARAKVSGEGEFLKLVSIYVVYQSLQFCARDEQLPRDDPSL